MIGGFQVGPFQPAYQQESHSDVVTGGGYYWEFERYQRARAAARRKRIRDEQQAEELQDQLDRQIALLLHKQEAIDAERADLDRLKALASEAQNHRAMFPELVQVALQKAIERQTTSALLAFERALRRQIEEEETAVLLILLND